MKSTIDRILDIDKKLLKLVNNHLDDISSLAFDSSKSISFTLDKKSDKINLDLPECSGLYFIELNLSHERLDKKVKLETKIKEFEKMWNHRSHKQFFSSSVKKKRICVYKGGKMEWLPFYIGKSKKIKSRVLEHIKKDKSSQTYALKLHSRENLYGFEFRISYLELPIQSYNFLMEYIESILRDKYNPIIGKQ